MLFTCYTNRALSLPTQALDQQCENKDAEKRMAKEEEVRSMDICMYLYICM